MMGHGGRNGIAASAGFRWILGSSKDKKEKDVKNINNKIKTQKQLNTTQIAPVEEIKSNNLKPIIVEPVVQPAPQQEVKPIKETQVDNNKDKIAEPAEVILNQTVMPEVKVIKTDNKVPEIQKPVAFELEEKKPEPAQQLINKLQSNPKAEEHILLETNNVSKENVPQRIKTLEKYNEIIQKYSIQK